jgi:putative oxidoreductase
MIFLVWASRILLAGVFLYSGYTKLQAELEFAAAIAGYRLLPEQVIYPVAVYLPWLEIALGLLLLSAWKTRYVAGFTAGLLSFFIVILTITYLRGIDANCGCFGIGERISPLTIARDGLFLIPALFLTLGPRFGPKSSRQRIP